MDYKKLKKSYFAADSTSKGEGEFHIAIFVDTETIGMPLEYKENGECVERWQLVRGDYRMYFCEDSTGLPRNIDDYVEGEFFSADEFIQKVTDLARFNEKYQIKIFAHNWDFDAGVLRIASKEMREKYRYSIPIDSGIQYNPESGSMAPFLLTLRVHYEPIYRGNNEYWFYNVVKLIDTTNFYKKPLKEIMKDMGMVKPDLPDATIEEYESDPVGVAKRYEERCKGDVEGLSAAWFALCRFGEEVLGVKPRTTIARMALAAFVRSDEYKDALESGDEDAIMAGITDGKRNKVYPKCESDYVVEEALAEGYRGGATQAFYKGVPAEYNYLWSYDVNSMFPSVMREKIAIRLISRHTKRETLLPILNQIIKHPNRKAKVKCNLYVPENEFYGLEGVRHKHRGFIFPVGHIKGVWLMEETYLFYKQLNCVKSVIEVESYFAAPIFKKWINKLAALKDMYSASGNGTFRTLVKLFMNSLYGVFGKKRRGQWFRVVNSDELNLLKHSTTHDYINGVNYYKGLDGEWYFYDKDYLLFDPLAVPIIAEHITSLARLKMLMKLRQLRKQGIDVFYIDTDSIKTSEMIDGPDVGEELGQWEYEKNSKAEDCNFYAPKDYVFDGEVTRKGDKNAKADDRESKNDIFMGFSKSLRRKSEDRFSMLEDGGCILRNRRKKFSGHNKKRIEPPSGNGWTQPLKMERNGRIDDKWRNEKSMI